jgi:hypothetical protein
MFARWWDILLVLTWFLLQSTSPPTKYIDHHDLDHLGPNLQHITGVLFGLTRYTNLNLLYFVATLALGSRPRQGVVRLRAKREAQECKRAQVNRPSHSQGNSHFGNWSLNGLPYFQEAITRVKTHRIKEFFISLKND